jgi:hypothetical protein
MLLTVLTNGLQNSQQTHKQSWRAGMEACFDPEDLVLYLPKVSKRRIGTER